MNPETGSKESAPDEGPLAVDDPVAALFESWTLLTPPERFAEFQSLKRSDGEEFFLTLGARDQAQIIITLPATERRSWMRLLAPDDAADVLQEVPPEDREAVGALLDKVTKREVTALLAYAEDEAGGLMSPRYARLRPDMRVDEAVTYLRRQARRPIETINYFYVLEQDQKLLGVVSLRDLFLQPENQLISEIMQSDVVSVLEETKQEDISRLMKQHDLLAIPVVDEGNYLKGIITVDDLIDAIEESVTEDIQKIGGTEALEAPYLEIGFWQMLRKRAGWMSILFLGEMFTANAMAYFEQEIARAAVLALFIPLVISSGGNSGSQASTLVVRAIALGEIRTRMWRRILTRELGSGLALGCILGSLGFLRVVLWPQSATVYGEHYVQIAITLSVALVGIVMWGTIIGSMLPLLLKRFGFDPASASAPFVATIVDVTGLIIYFTTASIFLTGILL